MRTRRVSAFARAGILVTSGTAAGQILLFLTSLVVVRLYSPEEMGLFATLSSVAACLIALSTGRFELAIPIPKSDLDSLRIARFAVVLSMTFATIIALVTLVVNAIYPESPLQSIQQFFWAIPVLIMGMAFVQIASQLAVRAENYKSVSQRAIIFPATAGALQIVAGVVGLGETGLIISLCVGQFAAFLALWVPTSRQLSQSGDETGQTMRGLISKYRYFPLFLSWAGFLNSLGTQTPQILVALYFGLDAAGQLGIAMKIIALPVALIGQSLAYVYNGEISKRARGDQGGVTEILNKMSMLLVVVGAGMAATLIFCGPWAFSIVLGPTWLTAGHFASILAVGVAAQLVASPVSQTLTFAGRLRTQFVLDLIRVIAVAGAFIAAAYLNASVETALILVTIAMAVAYTLVWTMNHQAARHIDRQKPSNQGSSIHWNSESDDPATLRGEV